MHFDDLSSSVIKTHQSAQSGAIRAINQLATLRNWLIGCYIVEYEQNGSDRAKYGDRLLKRLEESVNTKGLNVTLFQISRLFYNYYPQIGDIIYATVSHKLPQEQIYATPSHKFMTPGKVLLGKLSFSHIREIMTQDDPLARFFYETECIKGTWSVKELRRQIATNLYFRSGVSKDPKKLLATIKPEMNTPALTIRQPFTLEFLGLKAKDVITESDLEEALISHLQDFLLELGKGFCFEDRQKRIIIDDEYILPSASCYAPAKARRWWNTLLPAWTTNSLYLPTCSNCQTKPRWRNSSKMNLINNKSVPHRTEPFELVNILEPSGRKYGCSH